MPAASAWSPALSLGNMLLFLPGIFLPLNPSLLWKRLKMGPARHPRERHSSTTPLCVNVIGGILVVRAVTVASGPEVPSPPSQGGGSPRMVCKANGDLRVQGRALQDEDPNSGPVSGACSVLSCEPGEPRAADVGCTQPGLVPAATEGAGHTRRGQGRSRTARAAGPTLSLQSVLPH